MSVYSGPNINSNGIVFAYDMSNPDKSWKGATTTNLNTEQSLNGMSGISLTFIGIENGWKKYGLSGTWASGTYPFSLNISTTTLSGTVAYSAQAIIKTNVISKFLTFGGLNYVNDGSMVNSGASTVTSLGNDTDGLEMILSKREGFIYSAGFANPTTSQLGYINSRPTADGVSFNSSTDFVWIKNIQVEQRTFCTPWVQSARSNTQALLDLTGTTTITANSLTYTSAGPFSFNGSSDYISLVNNATLRPATELTIECVISPTATPASWTQLIGYGQADYVNGNYLLFFETGTRLCRSLARVNNTEYRCNTNFTAPLNQYTFVTFTMKTGDAIRSYFNGVADITASLPAGTFTYNGTTSPYQLGSPGISWFTGNMPMMRLYNRALSATEVQQNFNALRSRYGI